MIEDEMCSFAFKYIFYASKPFQIVYVTHFSTDLLFSYKEGSLIPVQHPNPKASSTSIDFPKPPCCAVVTPYVKTELSPKKVGKISVYRKLGNRLQLNPRLFLNQHNKFLLMEVNVSSAAGNQFYERPHPSSQPASQQHRTI